MAYQIAIYDSSTNQTEVLPSLFHWRKDAFARARRIAYAYESDPRIELYSVVVEDGREIDVLTMSDNLWYKIFVLSGPEVNELLGD